MNVLIVDTSAWIDYFAGEDSAEIDLALSEGRVYLPPIVAAELLSSRMKETQRLGLISLLEELPLCASELDHWIRVGKLRYSLALNGLQISTPDAHITQCALDLDGYLVSSDKIFTKIAKTANIKLLGG